ncbi:MAG: hypothetical protein IJ150_02365 [Bacteroidales bacterium]|nr:hypothetical protein [Bacteroidales bacterium]
MESNIHQNTEVHSRREFFKRTAKAILPLLCTVSLTDALLCDLEDSKSSYSCNGSTCKSECTAQCENSCDITCRNTCKYQCAIGCYAVCQANCYKGCSGT